MKIFSPIIRSLCVVALVSQGTVAWSAPNLRSTPIYQETIGRCEKTSQAGAFKTKVSAIWESFSFQTARDGFTQGLQVAMLSPTAIAQAVQSKGLTPRVAEMLHAPEFHQALIDCYGQDVGLQRAYIAGLVASDIGGKVVAAGVVVAAGYATVRIMTALRVAYPVLAKGIMAANASYLTYQTVRSVHEVLRKPTPQERVAALKTVAPALNESIEDANTVEGMLRDKITSLRTQLKTVDPSQKAEIQKRIVVLTDHLDQLENLNENLIKG